MAPEISSGQAGIWTGIRYFDSRNFKAGCGSCTGCAANDAGLQKRRWVQSKLSLRVVQDPYWSCARKCRPRYLSVDNPYPPSVQLPD